MLVAKNGRVEGLEPRAPGFGEQLDNLYCLNTLNILLEYRSLWYWSLRCSQHSPACVSIFVPFYVPRFIYEKSLEMRLKLPKPISLT